MILEPGFTYSPFGVVTGDRLVNVHERIVAGSMAESGRVLENLLDPETSVWPFERIPLEMGRGLEPGSTGGHGPIRYTVVAHEAGRHIAFECTDESPVAGRHEFTLTEEPGGGVRWRHELVIEPVEHWIRERIEPIHDSILETLLDRVEKAVGTSVDVGDPGEV